MYAKKLKEQEMCERLGCGVKGCALRCNIIHFIQNTMSISGIKPQLQTPTFALFSSKNLLNLSKDLKSKNQPQLFQSQILQLTS